MIDWRPSAGLENLKIRADLLRRTRDFFFARSVLEVETPILSRGATVDPQIESLQVRIQGFARVHYLGTSPEFAMKRLLAAGAGDIFQICKVFRDGELGRWHQPEFTLLEWYRLGFDDERLMVEVDALVRELLAPQRALLPMKRLAYAEALANHAGVNMHSDSDAQLSRTAHELGIDYRGEPDRNALLDLLMGMIVGPRLGHDGPTFVVDYPVSQASLARIKSPANEPNPVAARFELYLEGLELANGFHELADAAEQRQRFESDLAERLRTGKPVPPMDEHLLAALSSGMPDCAGVALGMDRLIAIAANATALGSVLSFDSERA
jgi:elongation factor P--(R)-beta-lysine ligase